MLGPEEKESIEKGFLAILIIWGAMLASLAVYLLIAHVAGDQIREAQKSEIPISLLKNILFGMAAAELLLAYYLRKKMLRGGAVKAPPEDTPLTSDQSKALARYSTAVLVSLAICESIGIYGLLLFFLGDEYQTLYILVGVAAAAMCFFRPKRDELMELALAMHGGVIQPPHMLH